MASPTRADLDLALSRIQADHRSGRAFFIHPYQMALVSDRRADWIAGLSERIEAGTYVPGPASVVNVPKAGSGIRTGAVLGLEDQVVYTAVVGAAAHRLLPALSWSGPPKDYAYRLQNPKTVDWIQKSFRSWDGFRIRSLELLDAGAAAVVSTDITGFYEHVDHEILNSDLRDIGVDSDLCDLVGRCLGRWASVNRRGLPQNLAASHLLAKLYLTRVDHALAELGLVHVRYVDDTRIFCASRADAKRAIVDLTVLLRARGLTLQTAKTKILLPGDAREEFEGVNPVLRPLAKHYVEQIAEQMGLDPEYMTVSEAEELVVTGQAELPAQMLRDVFDASFIKAPERFNKTLFHFLLQRLGRAKDDFALGHAIRLLETHPEETEWILRYIANVGAVEHSEPQILSYLRSRDAVYDYQVYQIIRWRTGHSSQASDGLLQFVRDQVRTHQTPFHVLSVCRAFLGRFGSAADIDALLQAYATATADLARCEIVCGISRMEKSRRNAFLGKVKDDGFLTAAAVHAVKTERDCFA